MKQGTTPKVGAALQVCLHHAARFPPLWERCPRAGSLWVGDLHESWTENGCQDEPVCANSCAAAGDRGVLPGPPWSPGVLASLAGQDPLRKAEADSDWESQH